ncbi:MAG: response regulator [Lachnospiraceae bacterium]|nr:response regulator [Lachnospiraceae bacterium]
MAVGEKKEIVAVDDSGLILILLERVLGERYDLHTFSKARRALEYLNNSTPDLLILDIDMPEMDGYQMLDKVKEEERLQNVPVFFLTSNNDKGHVMKAAEVGVEDYVVKPIHAGTLLSKVHALFGE